MRWPARAARVGPPGERGRKATGVPRAPEAMWLPDLAANGDRGAMQAHKVRPAQRALEVTANAAMQAHPDRQAPREREARPAVKVNGVQHWSVPADRPDAPVPAAAGVPLAWQARAALKRAVSQVWPALPASGETEVCPAQQATRDPWAE